MERCNMFKCAMAFLWSLFITFFILLCLASCEYEEPIKPTQVGTFSPSNAHDPSNDVDIIAWTY